MISESGFSLRPQRAIDFSRGPEGAALGINTAGAVSSRID